MDADALDTVKVADAGDGGDGLPRQQPEVPGDLKAGATRSSSRSRSDGRRVRTSPLASPQELPEHADARAWPKVSGVVASRRCSENVKGILG